MGGETGFPYIFRECVDKKKKNPKEALYFFVWNKLDQELNNC